MFFLLAFFISSSSFAQKISIKISGVTVVAATLLELEGEKTNLIDTVFSQKEIFQFSLKTKHSGFYRLSFEKTKWLDFIFDGKDIEFQTDLNNIIDSLEIVKSETNKTYYKFLNLNKSYKTKTELLQLILARYPKDDDYYETTKNKLYQLQNYYRQFVKITSQVNSNSFIARYIKSAQLPIIDISIPIDEQLTFLKSHSLDNINFDDAEMIYSNLFTNKSIEYLTYYRNQQLPKELLEKEFIIAVDTLLNKAKINQLVYQHITEYLIDGFKKFGFDKIIDYIVENYVIEDDLCLDEETENSIQRRIDQSKLLSVGTKSPNLILADKNGKVIDLSKIKAKKTLIVFYTSWCSHCQTLLPQLNKLYKNSKKLEILAISLDNIKEDWLKFIKDNNLCLINLNDPNGWDGTTAIDYYLYATPTMFLLDSEKKIIDKPTAYEELMNLL